MFEFVRGAITQEECRETECGYVFDFDRTYLSDCGCLARIIIMGYTLEVYPRGAESKPWVSARTITAFFVGALVLPSPFFGQGVGWIANIAALLP